MMTVVAEKIARVPLILASASPRRRELLAGLGLTFTVLPSTDAEVYTTGLVPREAVTVLAIRKALSVLGNLSSLHLPDGTSPAVLGADTLVELDGVPLGKPENADDAYRMLLSLSGRVHTVTTGVAVWYDGKLEAGSDVTAVRMRPYTPEEARAYVQTGEPMGKAGAYAIQGQGGALVEAINGARDNVIGLPCALLCRLLTEITGTPEERP